MLRNRCWKLWHLSLASGPRITGFCLLSKDLHRTGSSADFVRWNGHRAASAEVLAAVQDPQTVCLLFSPELFILSICITLSLRNVTTETGECVFLSHLSTDGESSPQLPGVFPAFLHSQLPLAPCWLAHRPSPRGRREASLQPA